MSGSNHCQWCGQGWCDECIAERTQLRNEVCQLRIKLAAKQEEVERLLLLFAEITALRVDPSGKHGLRLHEAIAFCKANAAEAKGGEKDVKSKYGN